MHGILKEASHGTWYAVYLLLNRKCLKNLYVCNALGKMYVVPMPGILLSRALLGISIRRLVYDSARGSFHNQSGLAIKVSGFGDTCKVEYLVANPIETSCLLQLPVGEYFYTLVKHFTALGYKRGQTIRSAPYDWRLSPGMYMYLNINTFVVMHATKCNNNDWSKHNGYQSQTKTI